MIARGQGTCMSVCHPGENYSRPSEHTKDASPCPINKIHNFHLTKVQVEQKAIEVKIKLLNDLFKRIHYKSSLTSFKVIFRCNPQFHRKSHFHRIGFRILIFQQNTSLGSGRDGCPGSNHTMVLYSGTPRSAYLWRPFHLRHSPARLNISFYI